MHIAIIGSGLSGLAAAATLANAGQKVTVFEQFSRPGGVTAPIEMGGYKWDLGQLLIEGLAPDEPLGRVLHELGVLDKIHVQVQDRGYVFPDFELKKPVEYQGPRWRIDALKVLFPEDANGLERYWKDYLRFTHLLTVARQLDATQGGTHFIAQLRLYLALLPFMTRLKWSAQQFMDSYFKSPKLQAVFISILADFFTPPSQFPGLGVFSLNSETVYDERIPKKLAPGVEQLYHYNILGGISTLVDALVEQIRSKGGQVLCQSPVSRIVIKDGRVRGVVVQGEMIPCDIVVASGGAKETFLKLVGVEHLPEDFLAKVRGQPLMDSVFMVNLGLDYDPSSYLLGPVTYFYGTYDLEGGIDEAHRGIYHGGEKGFVVHVPSLHTPAMAPSGCHAMTIYTICPDKLAEGSWSDRKEEFTDRLLYFAEQRIPGLRQHIQVVEILTPEDWRLRTHLDHHAFAGIAHILKTPRVPSQAPIKGLWFVGAQSESGGGVNNVIPAAVKVAKKILGGI